MQAGKQKFKGSIAGKTLTTMSLWIGVVIVVMTVCTYGYVISVLRHQALGQIEKYVVERGQRESAIFALAEDNHATFKAELLRRLDELENIDPVDEFNALVTRHGDGIYRNRPESFDGRVMPGVFIEETLEIDSDIRRRVTAFYENCLRFGPAWHNRFQDTYVTTPENIMVIYWPEIPNWCQQANTELYIPEEEYFWVSDKTHNPARETVWTGLFYDHVARVWMVSCETPVDRDGRHIGTIGHDITLNELLDRTINNHLRGAYNLIFREDGRLIVHPEWLEVIRGRKGYFDIRTSGDQHLIDIFGLVTAKANDRVIVDNAVHDEYLAVTRIEGPEWYFVTVYPKKLLSTLAFDTAKIILSLGLLSMGIYVMVLFLALRKHVMLPLQELVGATDLLAGGKLDIRLDSSKNDELGRLADAFNKMAAAVKTGIEKLRGEVEEHKRSRKALEVSEERYRSMFENSGAATVILEEDMTVSMVNAEFEKLTGYSKKEIEWKVKWPEFIAQEDHERLKDYHFERRKGKGKAPREYECRLVDSEGRVKDIFLKVELLPGDKRSVASFIDITHRKRAEVELRESEEHLRKENLRLRSTIKERYRFGEIIGKSPEMQEVYEFILKAASSNANVVIFGESGTGKEIVARTIHSLSDRKDHRFVPFHCGAIPENLLESELFGYRRGAFTGAYADKEGYFSVADGGTLFLDELGDIGLNMQVKLLRVIEGNGYTPVGGKDVFVPDVRLIAATNKDLAQHVKKGLMRDDFFYRINILGLYLPPLRKRKEDIPLLIDHFLESNHDGKSATRVPAKVMEALMNYDWPGNVRELQNVLSRYVTLKKIDLLWSSPYEQAESGNTGEGGNGDLGASGDLRTALGDFEKRVILETLNRYKWKKGKVAEALGVDRKTLFTKMKRYRLTPTEK